MTATAAPRDEATADARTERPIGRLVLLPVALFVSTLVLRAIRLGVPRNLAFDEVFYASDALDLLQTGVEGGRPDHPPLGKWLIAIGIEVFGFTPTGWRVAALVAGAALVVVTYYVALALTESPRLGALAALLVAVDGLTFAMGRLAMLEGFLTLFLTAASGLAIVAVHRQRVTRNVILAAGVALGCAVAVKWSAVPGAVLVVAMFLLADPRVRGGGWRPRALVAVAMVALPAAVYLAVYVPWFVNIDATPAASEVCADDGACDPSVVTRVDAWVSQQLDVLEFHRELRPTSWQATPGWTWITYPTPPVFHRKRCAPAMADVPEAAYDGVCPRDAETATEVRVEGVGNPVLWAGAGVAGLVLLWHVVRRRDPTALALVLLALAIWAPWLISARESFTFYATPLVPIFSWWIVTVLARQPPRFTRVAAPVVGVAAVVAFVWYYPALVGIPLDPGDPRFIYPFWT